MAAITWETPFDPAEVGKVPIFVWCPTPQLARDFVESYMPNDREWLKWWGDHREETIYALPMAGSMQYMYGPRRSLAQWESKGYVPRVFHGFVQAVEVGDLL